ncbi:hypothetical protein ACIBG8_42860 [Nonomuraea sp. NPDC050556]|uniref:hypothetical protein n=1 Tax=Nonomuraea sp. NPDC050556 TaxID=3364369 RepID=UPI0037AE1CEF
MPPSEVWRRQDAAEQATGLDPCPAGWPRPRLYGLPLPWITPVLDGVPYWTQIHGRRLLRCQQQWLCQVCGLVLSPCALVITDGELVTDAGLHHRCALLSLTVCEGLSLRMLLAVVARTDLYPLPGGPSPPWRRWRLHAAVLGAAAPVGGPAAARMLQEHQAPPLTAAHEQDRTQS